MNVKREELSFFFFCHCKRDLRERLGVVSAGNREYHAVSEFLPEARRVFVSDLAFQVLFPLHARISQIINKSQKEPDCHEIHRDGTHVKERNAEDDIEDYRSNRHDHAERDHILPASFRLFSAKLDVCRIELEEQRYEEDVGGARDIFERQEHDNDRNEYGREKERQIRRLVRAVDRAELLPHELIACHRKENA